MHELRGKLVCDMLAWSKDDSYMESDRADVFKGFWHRPEPETVQGGRPGSLVFTKHLVAFKMLKTPGFKGTREEWTEELKRVCQ